MDRRQPQDIHVPLFNNFIPPGAARTVHYRFKVPADATGTITFSAAANYRKFSRDYSIFFPMYSGVRPTMRPARNTAMITKTIMPYMPLPTPP